MKASDFQTKILAPISGILEEAQDEIEDTAGLLGNVQHTAPPTKEQADFIKSVAASLSDTRTLVAGEMEENEDRIRAEGGDPTLV